MKNFRYGTFDESTIRRARSGDKLLANKAREELF